MTIKWDGTIATDDEGHVVYKIRYELNVPWLFRAIGMDGLPSKEKLAWNWKCVCSGKTAQELRDVASSYETGYKS